MYPGKKSIKKPKGVMGEIALIFLHIIIKFVL